MSHNPDAVRTGCCSPTPVIELGLGIQHGFNIIDVRSVTSIGWHAILHNRSGYGCAEVALSL